MKKILLFLFSCHTCLCVERETFSIGARLLEEAPGTVGLIFGFLPPEKKFALATGFGLIGTLESGKNINESIQPLFQRQAQKAKEVPPYTLKNLLECNQKSDQYKKVEGLIQRINASELQEGDPYFSKKRTKEWFTQKINEKIFLRPKGEHARFYWPVHETNPKKFEFYLAVDPDTKNIISDKRQRGDSQLWEWMQDTFSEGKYVRFHTANHAKLLQDIVKISSKNAEESTKFVKKMRLLQEIYLEEYEQSLQIPAGLSSKRRKKIEQKKQKGIQAIKKFFENLIRIKYLNGFTTSTNRLDTISVGVKRRRPTTLYAKDAHKIHIQSRQKTEIKVLIDNTTKE